MDKEGCFPENKFEGEIENGQPNGNGIWTQCCGSKYVGQFVNGLREGIGTFTWSIHSPNGVGMYEGEYKKNRQSGKGIRTRSDGSKYDGIWKNGKLWKGTIYLKDGTILSKYEDGLPVKKRKKPHSSS
jgi:hypothetical protein